MELGVNGFKGTGRERGNVILAIRRNVGGVIIQVFRRILKSKIENSSYAACHECMAYT